MKTSLLVLVAAGWTGFAALAGPLPIAQVDANAQWLLHFDLDAFRASQVGAKIARDRIEEPMARAAAEIKQQLGVDFDWKRIHGVTAYGLAAARPGQDRGVLLLDTDLDVRAGLDAAIAKQPEGNLGRLRLIEAGDHPVYWVKDESYIALIASGPVIAGKFEEDVRRARDVVLGSVPNLAARDSFGGYPAPGPGLVFYGATQGLAEGMPVPPKAEILKQADGLRLLVSEAGGNLSLSLAMKTKTPEVAQQVRQVVQGLLALAALGQAGNPEVQEILAGLRVAGSERLVAVELAYPVAKALQKMDDDSGLGGEFSVRWKGW